MVALALKTVPAIAPVLSCVHLVTLINYRTGDERGLRIETASYRPVDVIREIAKQRSELGLIGYEIHEILDCNESF